MALDEGHKHLFIVVGVLGFAFLAIGSGFLVRYCIRRHKRRNDPEHRLLTEEQGSDGQALEFEDIVIRFNEIEHDKTLGEGYFGVVSKGKWRGADVAVKRLKEHIMMEDYNDAYKIFRREVIMYSNIRHHNIVQFMGVCLLWPNICIVLEYMEKGSVADIIHTRREVLSWRKRLKWAIDAAKGMAFLHAHNPSIIHRDLKSHNLLVDENDLVKVGDFGTAKLLGPLRSKKKRKSKSKREIGEGQKGDTSWAGTLRWAAPEVIPEEPQQKIKYTTASDVYSYGVTIWEMITNRLPFIQYAVDCEVMDAVQQGHRPHIPERCNPAVADLIESCWQGDPRKRPSFEIILRRLIDLQNLIPGSGISIRPGTWPPRGTPKEMNMFC